ncbi:MAG: hypothetical protein ABSB53_05310 [Nitrososphaerales archaeon]|jgi:hypothetical protein
MMDSYRPGVCNIGKNETRKRYAMGFVGLTIAGVLVYVITQLSLPTWSLLVCFFPLFLGAEGFLQGYFKFCAGFAARSIFDFSGSSNEKGKVTDKEAHNLDMRKAMRINLYSFVTAAVVTTIIYLAGAV